MRKSKLRISSRVHTRARRLRLELLEDRRMLANGAFGASETITVFEEDFEQGNGGFVADNSGGTLTGLWHHSVGRRRDGLPLHSADHSFYYGAFETSTGGGHYVLGEHHRGVLISPPIELPDCDSISLTFHYLLDTRETLNRDYVDVAVDDGSSVTTILSRQAGTLPETNYLWEEAYSDALSQYRGETIQLRFTFDTGDPPRVDPEGWYVDDVRIEATCSADPPPPVPDIAGYKWEDINGNGLWDDTEAPIEAWTVYLDLNGNQQLDPDEPNTQTDSEGRFEFYELGAGDYIVRELVPNDMWRQSFPASTDDGQQVTIDPPSGLRVAGRSGIAEAPNFGNVQADIVGFKWEDVDRDGFWDDSEPALSDWHVFLDMNGNGDRDPSEPETVTDAAGRFAFFGLPAGEYVLRESVPDDYWRQTYPASADGSHRLVIDPDTGIRIRGREGVAETPNFGNAAPDIAGYKWEDWDRDGLWDAGEPPLPGWTVFLDENGNQQLDGTELSVVTDEQGYFEFFELAAGEYIVRELLPSELWEQTYPGSAFQAHEVDVNRSVGERVVGRPELAEAPNFGNVQPEIVGYKWDDLNGDGVWDVGEPGLNGRTIYLDLNENGELDTGEPEFVTRFDGQHNGAYWFTDLGADEYTVRQQNDVQQSYPGPPDREHNVTINPSTGLRVHGGFGATEPPNFGDEVPDVLGYLWLDLDGDGQWESGEPGLAGWTVYLDADDDDQRDPGEEETVTDSAGRFLFSSLEAGTYTVRQVPPIDQWEQTYPGAPTFEHVVVVDPAAGISVIAGVETTEPPNFGNRLPPQFDTLIGGVKFDDVNRNGVRDVDELLLSDWEIRVYEDGDGDGLLSQLEFLAGPSLTGTTSLDGSYGFNIAAEDFPQSFIVVEVMQDGYEQTEFAGPFAYPTTMVLASGLNTGSITIGDRGYALTLAGGEDLSDLDFANTYACASKRCYLASGRP